MRRIYYWQPPILCVLILIALVAPDRQSSCGGTFSERRGVIHTPNFPARFPVPMNCRWVIDSSQYQDETPSKIILYFTQNYLTTDLTVTETKSLDERVVEMNGKVRKPEKRTLHIYTPDTYLIIDAVLKTLEGNHLRFLDDKKNVYYMFGFNATYEIVPIDEPIKKSCTPQICSLLGDCYADSEMKKFACKCFYGYWGENCTQGPLCENQPCKNGGTCVHLSAVAFSCSCPAGYNGTSCELAKPVDADTQCPVSASSGDVCRCSHPQPVLPGRVRYHGIIKISNHSLANHVTDEYIAKSLTKELKSAGLSAYNKLHVHNTSTFGERKFHFIGLELEISRVLDVFNRLEKRGKLFDVDLDPSLQPITKEPVLSLLSLEVPQKSVQLDEEFTISCVAEGSVYMDFTFFKDGAEINDSLSHRSLSLHLFHLPKSGKFQYTLVIAKATLLDQGMYTCRVRDYGMEQCSSVYITVPTRPEITLFPMSVTVEKGAKVDLRCIPSDKVPAQEKLAYTWIKNKDLLRIRPGKEVEEDLHLNDYTELINGGSVLEITDIEKSATYTCQVGGRGAKSEKSVWVEVVANKSSSLLCQPEGAYGVAWPLTRSNTWALVSCPSGGDGVAKRSCLKMANETTQWQTPDFSLCAYYDVRTIEQNMKLLTHGYDVTNTTVTLNKLVNVLFSRRIFRPGEGTKILELLELILKHLNRPLMAHFVAESVKPFYIIVDFLLDYEESLITDQQIQQLQKLVRKHGLIWASVLPSGSSNIINKMSNIIVETYSVGQGNRSIKFPTNSVGWFNNSLESAIDTGKANNSGISVVMIGYRRLNQFLPKRYIQKDSNGTEIEYELNSQILTVDLNVSRLTSNAFFIWLHMEPLIKDYDVTHWTWTCALADIAGVNPNWDLKACAGTMLAGNISRCICRKPGTIALLLVSRPKVMVLNLTNLIHTPVSIGCICCLVECILTLSLLLPHWWRHRTCVVFLKIQSCVSLIGAMGIFVYSVQTTVPRSLFPIWIAFLEIFLLLPLTGHLCILLIIYTEVMQIPTISRIKQSVVCITTGAPILAVLTNLLSHRSAGGPPGSWWLQPPSMAFTVFVTSALITCGLFTFLYFMVLRKLRVLCLGNSEKNRAVLRRLGLLRRCGLVFTILVVMEFASILYINVQEVPYQYFFGATSALLGLVMLICYAVKSESPPYLRLLKKLKMDPTTPDEFSSDSGISPLNFFTKQDGEQESDAAAPRRVISARVRDCDHQADPAAGEQLLLQENNHRPGKSNDTNADTLETYVYGDSSVVAAAAVAAANGLVSSPTRYKPMSSFRVQEGLGFGEYVEQEMPEPVGKPLPVQSYILDPKTALPTEMITTRVCVELGVITTHQRNEVTGLEENAPALVLCSVDVEPCQSRMISAHQLDGERVMMSQDSEAAGVVVCSVDVDQTRLITTHLQKNEAITLSSSDVTTTTTTNRMELEPVVPIITNGHAKKVDNSIVEEKSSKEEKNMDMLDRISHDLDYLLNRKTTAVMLPEIRTKRHCVQNDILEERDEDEEEENEQCSGPVEYLTKC